MRNVTQLHDDWRFAKQATLDADWERTWECVQLPHTWNAVDGQDGGNDYWRGTACYAKRFSCPTLSPGESLYLEIPGAAMIAEVYLDGEKLAHHEGGYSTFRVPLSIRDGEHVLHITVDNAENDRVYPQKADFTFYGGLYRGLSLLTVPQEHFALEPDGTPGIKITPVVDLSRHSAQVQIETWHNAPSVTISIEGDGIHATQRVERSATFEIENVHLWDGVDDPYLYTATATLDSGDTVSVRFGCRKIDFDPAQGFLLNGRVYPLRGVSRHQDIAGRGNALLYEDHKRDIQIALEIGANTLRLAHYQHAQAFYDLCDEAGLIVWAEIPYITQHMPNGRENTLQQMRELIVQCYNHPCVVCWGLSNEIGVHGITEDLMDNHRALQELCHRLDPTRPTTMAHAFMLETDHPLTRLADIGSYNLYFGWYLGTLEQNDSFFDDFHVQFPERVMGLSEYGADANIQYQSAKPVAGDYTESYQCVYHEYLLGTIDRHPWMWATHVWNLFDFAADGRDEGGKHGVNQKGLVTFDRKTRKDAFYLYKAAWSKEPFVHLCGSRYVDRTEPVTEIKVYSNQDSVSLYVDDACVETKTGQRVFTFQVPITSTHTIRAVSGALQDTMTIHHVDTPNPDYRYAGSAVHNWFDEEGFRTDCYSIRDTFGALMEKPETAAIVGPVMQQMVASRGDVAKSASNNAGLAKMMAGMSFESLLQKAGDAVSDEQVQALQAALQQIPKA